VIRLAAALISLFALTVPASGGTAASEAARLSYSLSALKAGGSQERLVAAGLCLADADGGEGDRLTAPKQDSSSAWSPDGRTMAFARTKQSSDGYDKHGIYVEDERGRTRTVIEVSDGPGSVRRSVGAPDWSPDGRSIVFSESFYCGVLGCYGSSIFSIRPDGSDLRPLNPGGSGFDLDYDPAWSPRGDAILFTRSPRGPPPLEAQGLYLVDADGGNRRLLVRDGYAPSWSPDGASVVFTRWNYDHLDRSSLVIIGADGRGERVLTTQQGVEENPAWSPDGEWIAFEQRAECGPPCGGGKEGTDIAVIRPDGSDLHVLRGSPLAELNPAWRPPAPRRPGPQRPCVRRGTHRADTIRGSSRGDLILAGRGRDVIYGGGGNDLIDGGRGRDVVNGGRGLDAAYADGWDRFRSIEMFYRPGG
jgi:Tol biopolymer transport system component